MAEFVANSCIRGYHIYKETWSAPIGQFVDCVPEEGNIHDPYAVAVVLPDSHETVGHVPRRISAVCRSFLGSIICQVTGHRRRSADLIQGGLEIPCQMTFRAPKKEIDKVSRLFGDLKQVASVGNEPLSKRQKTDSQEACSKLPDDENERIWLKLDSCWLTEKEKSLITTGSMLNDLHITFAQKQLLKQFPLTEGLLNPLLQYRQPERKIKRGLQIIHDRSRAHWLVASNYNDEKEICVYDSVYSSVSKETNEVIKNLFGSDHIRFVETQKQVGSKDCGAFAIAIATNMLFDPSRTSASFSVCQDTLRNHLLANFEELQMLEFP